MCIDADPPESDASCLPIKCRVRCLGSPACSWHFPVQSQLHPCGPGVSRSDAGNVRAFYGASFENRCRDAYRLAARSTYQFSTLDAFCKDNEGLSDNFESSSVRCYDGRWDGSEYLMSGDLRRRMDSQTASFAMRVRRQAENWLVVDFGLQD